MEVGDCDGTASATVQNTECTVLMETLRDTLGLSYGSNILAKVRATNLVGSGVDSNPTDAGSAATVETVPQTPSNLAASLIFDTNATLSWNSLQTGPQSGGPAVLSYFLEYKESSASSWSVGVGGSQASDYFTGNETVISGLTKGTVYDFRVSAYNLHGQSATSDPVTQVTTDDIPATPGAPTTSNEGLSVKIDWAAPAENGSPLQNYTITVQNGNGTYVEVDGCDGTAVATIQNTECLVTMQTLRDALGLTYGTDILAKVRATNLVGEGADSSATATPGAATVETVPQTPSNLTAYDIYGSNMTVSWNSLQAGA